MLVHAEPLSRSLIQAIPDSHQFAKALHVLYPRNVVEQDIALDSGIGRQPGDQSAQFVIGVAGVVALVPVQTPIQQLWRERGTDEWIHGVHQVQLLAERGHDVVRPRAARLPEETNAARPLSSAKEVPHRGDIVGRRAEARWAL